MTWMLWRKRQERAVAEFFSAILSCGNRKIVRSVATLFGGAVSFSLMVSSKDSTPDNYRSESSGVRFSRMGRVT